MTHLTFKKYFCCDILLYTEIFPFVKGFFAFFYLKNRNFSHRMAVFFILDGFCEAKIRKIDHSFPQPLGKTDQKPRGKADRDWGGAPRIGLSFFEALFVGCYPTPCQTFLKKSLDQKTLKQGFQTRSINTDLKFWSTFWKRSRSVRQSLTNRPFF